MRGDALLLLSEDEINETLAILNDIKTKINVGKEKIRKQSMDYVDGIQELKAESGDVKEKEEKEDKEDKEDKDDEEKYDEKKVVKKKTKNKKKTKIPFVDPYTRKDTFLNKYKESAKEYVNGAHIRHSPHIYLHALHNL